MNTEVEIEFDDSTVWDAVEDSVNDAAREAVDNGAWDAVCSDVENMIDDMIGNNGTDMGNVDEHLQSLLNQLASRTRNGDNLCALGTSARDAIVAVVKKANENSDGTDERVDQVRIDQDLNVQQRIATLERQVKTLLAAITDMGERAASVTPDSVV